MYTAIKNAILQLLTQSGQFERVYSTAPAVLEAFPCVTVEAQSSRAQDVAVSRMGAPMQEETYTFAIRIFYGLTKAAADTSNDARAEAEAVILQKVDALIDLLAAYRNLNGACDYTRPVSTTIGETQREMVVKYAELTLEVVKNVRHV